VKLPIHLNPTAISSVAPLTNAAAEYANSVSELFRLVVVAVIRDYETLKRAVDRAEQHVSAAGERLKHHMAEHGC